VIKQVAVVGNSFWGTTSPATAVKIAGSNNSAIHIADNPGYNPVGSGTAPPFVSGTPVRNPFPQAVRVYIVSATVTSLVITSPAGVATTTGIVATSSGAAFKLGVGESVTVLPGGVTAGSWKWFPL
jgi:hypothetical protein